MALSFCGRSVEKIFISRVLVQIFSIFIVLTCAVLSGGCEKQAGESARISTLEKENEGLRRELADASKKYVDASSLLGDIADKLASMTTQEMEIRGLQEELDPATYEVSEDLRNKIFGDLKTLETGLKEGKEKERQFSALTGSDPRFVALQRTANNFRMMLDEKEQVIATLQGNLDRLAVRAAELEKEVEEGQKAIATLEQRSREKDTKVGQQEETIAALRKEVGTAYYLIGSQQDIRGALESGEIARKWWTYRVSDKILAAGDVPHAFRTVSPEATEIDLGGGLKYVKVLSDHKHYDALFYIARSGPKWVLKLKNPLQFWHVSRYLIIEASTNQ